MKEREEENVPVRTKEVVWGCCGLRNRVRSMVELKVWKSAVPRGGEDCDEVVWRTTEG